jgi:hypothetical protein
LSEWAAGIVHPADDSPEGCSLQYSMFVPSEPCLHTPLGS